MLTSRFRIAGLCGLFFSLRWRRVGQIAGPVPSGFAVQESVGDRAVEPARQILWRPGRAGNAEDVYIKREFEIPVAKSPKIRRRRDRQTAPGQAHTAPSHGQCLYQRKCGPFIAANPGLTFDGVTGPTQTGAFPPDSMGDLSVAIFYFRHGRLRTSQDHRCRAA